MKRLIALLLAVGMVLSLAACGSSSDTDDDETTTSESTEESEESESDEESDSDEEETEETEEETEDESEDESEDSDEPVYGGSLNSYYFGSFPDIFDNGYQSNIQSFFTDFLWIIDWDADRDEISYNSGYLTSEYLVGSLAESWEIADDYSYIEVTIRDDVYFQDKTAVGMDEYDIYGGRQLTAEDVKYSYDRLLGFDGVEMVEFEGYDYTQTLDMLESVELVDDYTLIFHFNTTDEISVNDFMIEIVGICGEEWDELSDDDQADWHYACGTGPYFMTDLVDGNTMTFTKNESYWGTDSDGNQLPYLDEVNLVYISDSATLLASFISGEIDVVEGAPDVFDSDSITQIEAALDEDEYTEYTYFSNYQCIGLKQGDNPNEALTDVNVRTAMQYALDVEALSAYVGYTYEDVDVSEMLGGTFDLGTDWCDISSWSDELIDSYATYDPDYAMELLEEAGYADGFTFEVAISSDHDSDLYSLVGEYLAAVGIDAEFTVCSTQTEMQNIGQDASDPTSVVAGMAVTSLSKLSTNFGDGTVLHINDEEIDSLLTDLLSATTLDEQIELAKEFDQTFMAEHYLLMVTYNQTGSRWVRGNVKGYSGESLNQNNYYGIIMSRIWVDDEE